MNPLVLSDGKVGAVVVADVLVLHPDVGVKAVARVAPSSQHVLLSPHYVLVGEEEIFLPYNVSSSYSITTLPLCTEFHLFCPADRPHYITHKKTRGKGGLTFPTLHHPQPWSSRNRIIR